MRLLDEQGRVFGLVNIIDLLTVLLAIGVIAASVVVFVPRFLETEEETVVQFQVTGAPDYVADSVSTGPVPSNDDIIAIINKSVRPVAGNNSTSSVLLSARTRVTINNGDTYLNGERIYVGKTVTLDLGNVVVEATVTQLPTRE